MTADIETVEQVRAVTAEKYKYGFVTDIESETTPPLPEHDNLRGPNYYH